MKKIYLIIIAILAIAVLYRVIIYLALPNVKVTSWFRTPWHNKELGGVWNSLHQIGWGFDIVPVNDYNKIQLKKIFAKVIDEKNHIHVQVI